MFVSILSEVLLETWRESCVFTWTTQLVVDRVSCFPKLCPTCVIVIHFVSGKVGEGMFCGARYVQNKDSKDIMITQTEFAVKITKFMRFVVLVAVSVGWLVKHVQICPVKCLNCSKLCLNQLSLRCVHQAWWCVVFINMLIWVSRSDE